ncbi:FISUMP domain-containing protein [Ekhidna sp.]|uniref:FISUMP domain-containing protein n=1 Tax=Ekhidna sp. TaxID=2608089 RepID=UPI003CCC21C8
MKLAFILSLLVFTSYSQDRIVDQRDGKQYPITKLGNLYWMTSNLTYNAKESICPGNCDQIRFYDYRFLNDVCPTGWRLPSMEEWNQFAASFEDAETARMMEGNKKLFRIDFLDQYNIFESNVLNIGPYGRIEGGEVLEGNYIDFWTANSNTDERFHMHLTPYSIMGHAHKHNLKPSKPESYRLFAIRCVCDNVTD